MKATTKMREDLNTRAEIIMVVAPLLDPEDKTSVIQNKPWPSSSFKFISLP